MNTLLTLFMIPSCEACGNTHFFTIRTEVITFFTQDLQSARMFKARVQCEACGYKGGYAVEKSLDEAEAKAITLWNLRIGRW